MVDPGREAPARLVVGEHLAQEIRRLRHEAGLSQPEVAARIGYTPQYVSIAERSRKGLPSAELVAALDAALEAHGALIELRECAVQERHARRESPAGDESDPGVRTPPVPAEPLDAHTTAGNLLDPHDLAALTERQRRCLLTCEPRPGIARYNSVVRTADRAGFAATRETRTHDPACAHSPAGTVRAQTEDQLIMAAAREAGDHAGRDGAGNLEETTLDQLADHARRLARAYLTGPMLPLFGELVLIRNRAYELLERTERLAQRHDLYLVAGQLSCLLAGTSCDLGHPAAAIEHARAARTYAELIGHPALWAYASGMLSTFFCLEAQHHRGLEHARAGLARLPTGSAAVRLHSLEALACSKLRLDDDALRALTAATRARDEAPGDDEIHDRTGGMFTSTPAKQAYMAAMSYTNLQRPRATITEATQAIELWSNGPAEECAGSALAVTRIDLVTAHLLQHDLDAAREALLPVLAVPAPQRTTIVVKRLDSLERPLTAGSAARSTTARHMAAQIEAFRAAAPLHLPDQ